MIDILKGAAISMVLVVHSANLFQLPGPWNYLFSYGQMGTQLFFLLSAFSLSLSWSRKQGSERSFRTYFVRRIQRIAPGYWFMILLYALIAFAAGDLLHQEIPLPIDRDPLHVLVNVLFLNGLVPDANNLVVLSGWYVGTAMILYALFPFLYSLYERGCRRRRSAITMAVFLAVLAVRVIIELFNHYTYYSGNNSFMYFSFINQLPVFCLGIQLFFDQKAGGMKRVPAVILAAACTLLSLCLFQFNNVPVFTIIPFVSGCSFYCLYSALAGIHVNEASVPARILASFGRHSYAVYLGQPLVIFWGLAALVSRHSITVQSVGTYLLLLAPVFVLCYLLGRALEISSGFCFRWIEKLK